MDIMNKTSLNGSGVETLLHQMNNTLVQFNETVAFQKLKPPFSYLLVVGTLSIFGIIGNILTLIVLWKRKQWTSVNVLIGLMSLSDLCALLVLSSIFLQVSIFNRFYDQTVYFQDAFISSSNLCAVIIGSERAFAVRRPLKFRDIWSLKITLKLYTSGYLISIGFILMRCLISELISYSFFQNHVYLIYFIALRGFPFIIILVTNCLMIHGVVENSRRMLKMIDHNIDKNRIRKETVITKTVIALTTIYFVCMIPHRIAVGLKHAGIIIEDREIVYYVQNTVEIFNFSINIVIYTTSSKLFRTEYKNLICSALNPCRRSAGPISQEI
ncbi:unnamed protein product [Mytilus coruscus]|uniref:G-protein coupled receptors family 1 profile domain-containing protein n=1 Tax=Mytilus coruscus TaxID=42192 RepID=A0A6J8AC39_MYTCO|nr:unnamed protein product [Mytilus coruscus]